MKMKLKDLKLRSMSIDEYIGIRTLMTTYLMKARPIAFWDDQGNWQRDISKAKPVAMSTIDGHHYDQYRVLVLISREDTFPKEWPGGSFRVNSTGADLTTEQLLGSSVYNLARFHPNHPVVRAALLKATKRQPPPEITSINHIEVLMEENAPDIEVDVGDSLIRIADAIKFDEAPVVFDGTNTEVNDLYLTFRVQNKVSKPSSLTFGQIVNMISASSSLRHLLRSVKQSMSVTGIDNNAAFSEICTAMESVKLPDGYTRGQVYNTANYSNCIAVEGGDKALLDAMFKVCKIALKILHPQTAEAWFGPNPSDEFLAKQILDQTRCYPDILQLGQENPPPPDISNPMDY